MLVISTLSKLRHTATTACVCTFISELLSDGHALIGSVDACASLVCVDSMT